MKISLKALKSHLSKCHLTSDDTLLKLIEDAGPNYWLNRAIEAVREVMLGKPSVDNIKNLTLAIQLLNMVSLHETIRAKEHEKGRPGSQDSESGNSSS